MPVINHIAMLQDLAFLEARVAQLVELTRQLRADHSALAHRATTLEQERDSLLERLVQQEAEYKDVAAQATRHRSEMDAQRSQFEQSETRLRSAAATEVAQLKEQLERQQAEHAAVQRRLQDSQVESSNLRQVAAAACQRIEAVLVRLPGAPQE